MEEDVSLASFTTLRLGGKAAFFVRAKSVDDIAQAIRKARARRLPVIVLGEGSNVLVADKGVQAVVIKNELRGITWEQKQDDVWAIVAAGESWDMFVAETVRRNVPGIENLSGIPGTVGATPVQNVGAYGVEVSDVIEWVDAFDSEQEKVVRISNEECEFGYRDSMFKRPEGKRYVITHVCFRLRSSGAPNLSYKDAHEYFKERDDIPALEEVRNAILTIRSRKFPDIRRFGTAGSFFKNPVVSAHNAAELRERFPDIPQFPQPDGTVKLSLAWILDHLCGIKGVRIGNVGTYEKQPLVLLAYDGATEKEVKAFASSVVQKVKDMTGIKIEQEVTYVE